jgi:hypothetical protein
VRHREANGRGRAVAAAMTPLAVAAVMATSTATASATTGHLGRYGVAGARIRSQPSLGATVLGLGYPSMKTCVDTNLIGESPKYDWWYNIDLSTRVAGWTDQSLIGLYYTSKGYETCTL